MDDHNIPLLRAMVVSPKGSERWIDVTDNGLKIIAAKFANLSRVLRDIGPSMGARRNPVI